MSSKHQNLVKISPASYSDARAMAEISLLAFRDAPNKPSLFPEYVGLSASELLSQYSLLASRRMERRIIGNNVAMKATIQAENAKETVIGFALWTNPTDTRLVRRTLWEWILFWIIHPIQGLLGVKVGHSLPAPVKDIMAEQYEATFGKGCVAEGLKKPWYLHIFAVHPAWQKIGAGTKLLHWGFAKAEQDKAPVYLESGPQAYSYYVNRDFKKTVAYTRQLNGKTITFPSMIWLPPSLQAKSA